MPSNRVLRVAADGSGEFRTVQEAIDAVPLSNRVRTVIQVAPGLYREPVYVPKTKNFITLAASRPETTILSWDNTATRINHHQVSRTSPPPGARTLIGTGTFGCGSTIVEGEDFIAENITFENKAPQFPVLKHRKNALGGTQVAAGFSLSSKPSTPQLGAAEGPLLLLAVRVPINHRTGTYCPYRVSDDVRQREMRKRTTQMLMLDICMGAGPFELCICVDADAVVERRKLHSVRFKLVLLSTAPAHSIEDFLYVVDCGYVEETHVLTCLARGNNVRRKQQRLTEPPPAVLEIRTHTNLDARQISQHGAPLR
ncbi:hypothetical protein GW17_00015721 [Ensete ventricosum]|nr:hypothetical protein GW17_00015721 [Ensete ventricosum]RZR81895.1 hypothetical protein BHM03_00008201 [Ensete ventricosum]